MQATSGNQVAQARLGDTDSPHLMADIPLSSIPAVNVASVPQRSLLRYPGGKTWLVPHIRAWLGNLRPAPSVLLEPFAGGGIVSLTAVMEDLVSRCLMAEIDRDVAAFWHATLRHKRRLRREFAASSQRESLYPNWPILLRRT